jgi:hypothetical protein
MRDGRDGGCHHGAHVHVPHGGRRHFADEHGGTTGAGDEAAMSRAVGEARRGLAHQSSTPYSSEVNFFMAWHLIPELFLNGMVNI